MATRDLNKYGEGPEQVYDFGGSTSGAPLIPTGSSTPAFDINSLSDASKKYLIKKWGLWSGTEADTGVKGVADTLSDVNKIISYKGGSPVTRLSQVDSALGPLIAKRNKKGLGGIAGVLLPVAASLVAPGIGTALGLGTLGTAAVGAGLGAAAGGLGSGSLRGALIGGATGGIGGYVGAGGLSNLATVRAVSGPLAGQLVTPGVLTTMSGAPAASSAFLNAVRATPLQSVASAINSKFGPNTTFTEKLSNLSKAFSTLNSAKQGQQGQQQTQAGPQQQQVTTSPYSSSPLGRYVMNRATEGYSEGGLTQPRLIKGAGDGMSDSVPAIIRGGGLARLSDSEHVTPALQVALLGRGSPEAGSKRVEALVNNEIKKIYGKGLNAKTLQNKAMSKGI